MGKIEKGKIKAFFRSKGKKFWVRSISGIMAVTLAVNLVTPIGFATTGGDKVDVIVQYKDEIPEEEGKLFGIFDISKEENVQELEELDVKIATVPALQVIKYQLDDEVEAVELVQPTFETSLKPEDFKTGTAYDWNNEMVGAFDAWADGYTGKGVKVAVLDTGFDPHDEITYAGGASAFDTPYTSDENGHGTHVAGIIGAHMGTYVQGIAPDVSLYGYKTSRIVNGQREGHTGHILQGINWAIENDMDIINLSSGWRNHSQIVYNAIVNAVENDILFITSAGNEGEKGGTVTYPAPYDEVIAVGAVDPYKNLASYSSWGPEVDVVAPGGGGNGAFQSERIIGLYKGNSYALMSGTSQAVPHVAGVAALLMEKFPNYSAHQIEQLLIQGAEDLGAKGKDDKFGHGLISYSSETVFADAPVIEYDGELEIEVPFGDTLTFPTATATHETDDVEVTTKLFDPNGKEISLAQFDSTVAGEYRLEFHAQDSLGNKAEPVIVRIIVLEYVDDEAPVINYEGDTTIHIPYGEKFEIPSVAVTDNVDENIQVDVQVLDEDGKEVNPNDIDTTIAGTYTVKFQATDKAGNSANPVIITVVVDPYVDTTAPNLVYNGPLHLEVKYDGEVRLPVVTAEDEFDEHVDVVTTIKNEHGKEIEEIDSTKPGTYTVTYTAKDKAGNEAEPIIVTIVVKPYVDTVKPVIHYDGDKSITLPYGADFEFPVVTVTDNVDQDLEASLSITKDGKKVEFDTKVAGKYTFTYNAIDKSGNTALPLTITVTVEEYKDTVKPVINYDGPTTIELEYGADFEYPVVTVTDNVDENLEARLTIRDSDGNRTTFSTTKAGTYVFSYNAMDSARNQADTLEITVIVNEFVDDIAPVLNYDGEIKFVVEKGEAFNFPIVTATDNVDENVEVELTITKDGKVVPFNTNKTGEYLFTYQATDKAGNKSEPLEIVVVVKYTDVVAPFISYDGETEIHVGYGEAFDIPKVTVTDNVDGEIGYALTIKHEDGTVYDINEFSTEISGTYTFLYTAVDKAGNKAEFEITVVVNEYVDDVAPTLNYDGVTEITVEYGETFKAPVVTATDNVDEDVKVELIITNQNGDVVPFETTIAGTYFFTYTATDNAGNKAEPVVVKVTVKEEPVEQPVDPQPEEPTEEPKEEPKEEPTEPKEEPTEPVEEEPKEEPKEQEPEPVVDTEKPVISYDNSIPSVVAYGAELTIPKKLLAVDNVDGNIEAVGVITNANGETLKEIDTTIPGTYTVTYTAVDKAGNESVLTITVTVEQYVDKVAPTITYKGDNPIVLENGQKFSVPNVKVSDNHDKNPNVSHVIKDSDGKTVSAIDTTLAGNYTIEFTAVDEAGNTSALTIAVVVKDVEIDEEVVSQIEELFNLAVSNESVSHLDAAFELINELPDGDVKNELVKRFNVLKYGTENPSEDQLPVWTIEKINGLLQEIATLLEAYDTVNAKDKIELVEDELKNLPSGPDKEEWQARLEVLRNELENIEKELEEKAKFDEQVAHATELVVEAEVNPTEETIAIAQQAINELPDSEEKTALQARLNAIELPIEEPVEEPVEEPKEEPEQPEEPVEEPKEEPTEPIETPADPVEPTEPVEEPKTEEPAEQPEEPEEEPQEPADEPVQEPTEEPITPPADDKEDNPTNPSEGSDNPVDEPKEADSDDGKEDTEESMETDNVEKDDKTEVDPLIAEINSLLDQAKEEMSVELANQAKELIETIEDQELKEEMLYEVTQLIVAIHLGLSVEDNEGEPASDVVNDELVTVIKTLEEADEIEIIEKDAIETKKVEIETIKAEETEENLIPVSTISKSTENEIYTSMDYAKRFESKLYYNRTIKLLNELTDGKVKDELMKELDTMFKN